MDTILSYVNPKLVILIIVVYFIGNFLHNTNVRNAYIPIILTFLSIVLSALQIISSINIANYKDVFYIIFEAITQGITTAGMAVYSNQLIKQSRILNKAKDK